MLLLTSDLFAQFKNLKFFMTTKIGGDNKSPYYFNISYNVGDSTEIVRNNRSLFLNSVAINDLAIPKQTHSKNILIVEKSGVYENCDALITKEKNVYLSITVADCVPIFFYDKKKDIIAAVHSGWRGTAQKIVTETLGILMKKFNCESKDIITYIGPSASVCCYEVDEITANNFSEEVKIKKDSGKFILDLKKDNYLQIKQFNIPDENIEISKYCTICNPDLFHSYRRDSKQSGRMLVVFGMN